MKINPRELTDKNLCPTCDKDYCERKNDKTKPGVLTCPIYSVNWDKSHMGKLERLAFGDT